MYANCFQQGLAAGQVRLGAGGTRRSSFAVHSRKQFRNSRTAGLTRCQAASTGVCLCVVSAAVVKDIYVAVEVGADQSVVSQLSVVVSHVVHSL